MTESRPHPLLGQEILAETDEELIEEESNNLRIECNALADREDTMWLPDWYLRKLEETKMLENRIKEQSKALLRQLKARRQALQFRFGATLESIVTEDIMKQGGKKKSVKYLGGTAGYRKVKDKLIVLDEQAFKDWFDNQDHETRMELQKAFDLKLARKTPILEYILATGDIPAGVEIEPAHDKFYPSTDIPQLTKG